MTDLPSREEGERLLEKLRFGVDEIRDGDALALLALARLGLRYLHPSEEAPDDYARGYAAAREDAARVAENFHGIALTEIGNAEAQRGREIATAIRALKDTP